MDRKFVLSRNFVKHHIKGAFKSNDTDYSRYSNTYWSLDIAGCYEFIQLKLHSKLSNESNLWSIDVEYTFSVVSGAGDTKKHQKLTPVPLRDTFNCQTNEGQIWSVSLPEIIEFIVNGALTIVCEVTIINTRGLRQERKRTFDEPIDGITDVVLVVGGQKFHASKMILANMSPVFQAMFYGDFQESKMTEVKIDDVKPEDFEKLLSCMYQTNIGLDATNVASVLKIADRFDVEPLTNLCEQFLLKTNGVSIPEKLELSEEFNLSDLQNSCIETFKTKTDMWNVLYKVNEMGGLTAKALLKKAILLM